MTCSQKYATQFLLFHIQTNTEIGLSFISMISKLEVLQQFMLHQLHHLRKATTLKYIIILGISRLF